MTGPLAIIPAYVADEEALDLTRRCLSTLVATAPELDVLVVDDHSPRRDLVTPLVTECALNQVGFHRNLENRGFATTVNVGLRQALDEGRDALLVNADVEFFEEGWLDALLRAVTPCETCRDGRDAVLGCERCLARARQKPYVVGAQLLFPSGLIQHAGIYYSVLHRTFDHIFRLAPGGLPEARVPRVCPVTGALQLIRHEALALVGLYDEDFPLGYEDVDYCLRVFGAGRDCVYQPLARAIHREGAFRWDDPEHELRARESLAHLERKHAGLSFGDHVPTLVAEDPR